MSFEFKWPKFSPSFYDHAKNLLSTALNKGDKPAIIADRIEVNQLDMGTIPPDLEILEIGDLGRDRFRGIFRMTYAGDASIRLQTKVQVNPLRQRTPTATSDILTTPPILFASTPLIVPMSLSLSSLKLRAIVVLVISRLEGVTLVFKNDPLESVQVSSSFDSLAAIQTFLQSEIERQLRDLFRTELPSIIHQLSRRWLGRDNPDGRFQNRIELPSPSAPATPTPALPTTQSTGDSNGILSVPDEIECYDPTYGLRPSHPPLVGYFTNYRSLIKQKNRKLGLGAVLSHTDDEEDQNKEDATPSDVSSSTLFSPHSPTPSPQQKQRKPTENRTKKPMIKPKIFHSHSAGIVNSALSSSGLSSRNGQEGTRSSFKVLDSRPKMKLDDLEEARAEEEQLEEGEVLRSRRLERLSMQSHAASSSGLAARMMSIRETVQTKRPEQIRTTTSPISAFRTQPLPRPTSSVFPSTQRSSTTCLPAYASNCGTPVRSHAHPSIFLGSRSTSPTAGEEDKFDKEDEESEAEGSQCALLASLVRGNWTLSPFSRSISHFAARSTPLRRSSPSSAISSPTRVGHQNGIHSFYSRDPVDLDQLHLRTSWNDIHTDGFKQKRVTKINKKN
ncbi:hypothetical protein PTTG_04690 [Puccinia triticina 1-1 BBBD Race 1]|uniref:Mitochondrial distribution and morphology protein 34 n=1 Tax=Puccinia triticina (isolate 1-1 / race 1 (BBBD)) TaxID=630390 RepID=A0A180GEW4_PUCT1|nr:hypothetical protein PTTG_04690 [Puccinia triticina 1-1 BBBD Race 1]